MIKHEVDPNMISVNTLTEPDIKLYDVRQSPFEIYGLYKPQSEPVFKRIPDEVAKATSKGVMKLYLDTAGGRVRFSTDSPYIAIKAAFPFLDQKNHMSLLGSSGFDLYEDFDGEYVVSRFVGAFRPDLKGDTGFESVLRVPKSDGGPQMRHFTINMPPYNHVDSLYIGLSESAAVAGGKKYINDKPVVFYGSSITQGACSSRPGMNYQNIISRKYNIDYLNLGFSGNGKAEIPMVEYLASLEMSMFVSDYDHNAPTHEYLRETHARMYDMIREKQPTVPYLMLSRPDFDRDYRDSELRRNVVADTFRYAREKGDKNVYYIDGEGIFRGPDEDLCSVDGAHPNDYGFAKMADSIAEMMKRAMRKKKICCKED